MFHEKGYLSARKDRKISYTFKEGTKKNRFHVTGCRYSFLDHLHLSRTYNELSQKTGFNLLESRHCAYITYSVETWFLKKTLSS